MIAYEMERMFSEMLEYGFVIALTIVSTEGRVFCNDKNASPWKALGYSCPVNCHNIRYAIERLKMADYERFISKDVTTHDNMNPTKVYLPYERRYKKTNITDPDYQYDQHDDTIRIRKAFKIVKKLRKPDALKEFSMLLQNENVLTEFENKLKASSAYSSAECSAHLKKNSSNPDLLNHILEKCVLRSNDVEFDFLYTLSQVLNKHTKKIRFDVEMTRILLQEILGSNLEVRNGVMDINKILHHLRMAIEKSERTVNPNAVLPTVKLRSTHCVSAYVVGCFCKRGFVENSGRCVRPINCTSNTALYKYIARIYVH